jgi:tryptophan synthase alpha chain
MSDRYQLRFGQLKESGKKIFMPFTLLGYPDRQRSLSIILEMIESGASALELGIAFSDPIADGPVIQKAANETLASGFKLDDAFVLIREVRKKDAQIPIGILVYLNMVSARGVERFFKEAQEAGIDGILIADLPAEGAEEVEPFAIKYGISIIYLVSPVTTPERLQIILDHAGGFIYLVSRLGVTGTSTRSQSKDAGLKGLIDRIKSKTKVPICAGFGISTPADARNMFDLGVDGVITGSRVIQLIEESDDAAIKLLYKEMVSEADGYTKRLKAGKE